MKTLIVRTTLMALIALSVIPTVAQGSQEGATAVAYPWSFRNGHEGSKETAMTTLEEICRRADYESVAMEEAADAWTIARLPKPTFGKFPTVANLTKFGRAVKADRVLYGSISWHTRSIWVNAGPKTISTATVTAYVLNVQTGRIIYKRTATQGRSDERSSGLKIAAAVLFTPLVTAVSGGPATPQEQRAVQIALAKAYSGWSSSAKKVAR